MTINTMLSAKAIAAEILDGRMEPDFALNLGDKNAAEREEYLHIYAQKASPTASGKGPLNGIAIGVKDIFDTHDLATAFGSEIYADHQPSGDAALVTMFKNAGATIAGKTITTEFAWFSPGPTRNPHNEDHTPGGSSSGSAAGVAAGYFPAAIGSQTGGSVIRPAAFCGVAGFKPSFRLFPTVGMKHFSWSLDTPGFFAASIADVAFVAAACSGRDLMVNETNSSAPRIGLYHSTIDDLMDDDMAKALVTIGEKVKNVGGDVTTVKGPEEIESARQAHHFIQGFEACIALGDELRRFREKLSPALLDYLTDAGSITAETYDNNRRIANHARKASRGLFEKCDVLLMPSAPGTAPNGLETTGDSSFNRLWTLLGMPAVNVPGVTGENGLPLGLQIVAPFGKDKQALQAAHWLERLIREG